MNNAQGFRALVLAVIGLVSCWSHRSCPPGETAALIQRLGEASQCSESRLDDLLVEIARLLGELRKPAEEESAEA